MSNDNDQKHHVYDGIVEHDNPLPNWWIWTFLFTIIFAFLYFLHYEVAGGPTLEDELKISMAQIEKQRASHVSLQPVETEADLAAAFAQVSNQAAGIASYQGKCAACHGDNLQGVIGPNLVDKHWIHGKGAKADIVKIIREGAADKGMPPWGPVLSKEELISIAAFIYSKRGSNPGGAKAPQGEAVEAYLEGK